MLRLYEVKGKKGGQQKLILKKFFVCHVESSAITLNLPYLLVNHWTPQNPIGFYDAQNKLFVLPGLNNNRTFDTIFWKTYYKWLLKINIILDG